MIRKIIPCDFYRIKLWWENIPTSDQKIPPDVDITLDAIWHPRSHIEGVLAVHGRRKAAFVQVIRLNKQREVIGGLAHPNFVVS